MESQKFQALGSILHNHRKRLGVGIKAAARAIDVDYSYISKLEKGIQRPSRQTLQKLIDYYNLSENEVGELIRLTQPSETNKRKEVIFMTNNGIKGGSSTPLQVRVPENLNVLYTDAVQISSNQYGVVLSVMQLLPPTNQATVVAKIGMSREHAKSLANILLKHAERGHGEEETRKVVN